MNDTAPPSHRFRKIAIMGGGAIGIETAKELSEANVADEIMLWNRPDSTRNDEVKIKLSGITQAHIARDMDAPQIKFTTDLQEVISGTDINIVTAGLPRKPGQERPELLAKNSDAVDPVARAIRQYAPDSNVIVVSNPVDTLTQRVQEVSGLPRERIVGLSGVLDRARMLESIMKHLHLSSQKEIRNAHVVGQHGKLMVPVLSTITVKQGDEWVPLSDAIKKKITAEVRDQAAHETQADEMRNVIIGDTVEGGGKFVKVLKTSDHYGPSGALVKMVQQIAKSRAGTHDPNELFAASSYDPEHDIYIGQLGTFNKAGEFASLSLPRMDRMERATYDKSVADLQLAKSQLPPLPFKDQIANELPPVHRAI